MQKYTPKNKNKTKNKNKSLFYKNMPQEHAALLITSLHEICLISTSTPPLKNITYIDQNKSKIVF